MKRYLLLAFLLIANYLRAQIDVRPVKDVDRKELTSLLQKYGVGTAKQGYSAIFDSLFTTAQKLSPTKGFKGLGMLMYHVMVNDKGRVDHVFFESNILDDSLRISIVVPLVDALKSTFASAPLFDLGKPFVFNCVRTDGTYKPPREVRKGDSLLTEVTKAMTFKDSLSIKRLFFDDLDLTSVPDVIYRFPNLRELHVGKNKLTSLRIDMSRLPKLKQIHAQRNLLTNDSVFITKNKQLQLLNLNENRFTDIPRGVRTCLRLNNLWLGGNTLTALSNGSFRKLKRLKDLNFYGSGLTVLPGGIRKMKRLEVFDLYRNKLEVLPANITRLKRLTHLAISYNQLSALPAKIGRLKNVHTLYAHHNRLSRLPDGITALTNLRILDIGYNWYSDFPPQILAFQHLDELDLSANNFQQFPMEVLKVPKLTKLFLRGNPFSNDNESRYATELGTLRSRSIEVFY